MRASNIELCRIVLMMIIIAHHAVVHGGAINIDSGVNKFIATLIIPGGKVGFITFVVISSWFLVGKSFALNKFIKTYLMVMFYTVMLTLIVKFMGGGIKNEHILASFFPIAGISHGFAATYLAFYLILPFLNILYKNMHESQLRIMVSLLFYYQIVIQVLSMVFDYTAGLVSSELTLFVFIFFFTAYLKQKVTMDSYCFNKKRMFFSFLAGWMLICMVSYVMPYRNDSYLIRILVQLAAGESSVFYLLEGYLLFFIFYKTDVEYSLLINKIAHVSFAVLLLHDHIFFRPILWHTILKAENYYYSSYFFAWIIFCVVVIYTVGGLIESVREKIMAPIYNSLLYAKFIDWLNGRVFMNVK